MKILTTVGLVAGFSFISLTAGMYAGSQRVTDDIEATCKNNDTPTTLNYHEYWCLSPQQLALRDKAVIAFTLNYLKTHPGSKSNDVPTDPNASDPTPNPEDSGGPNDTVKPTHSL